MKVLLYLSSFFALFGFGTPKHTNYAQVATIRYAQIMQVATLYDKVDDEYTPITTLPPTYFVIVLGDSVDGYHKASYLDLDGYIQETDISIVDFEPETKFATGRLEISNTEIRSINLRSTPNTQTDDNIIDEVAKTNDTMSFYGTRDDTTTSGNKWYYISVTIDNQLAHGYVYAANTLSHPIPENIITPVTPPTTDNDDNNATPTPQKMSDAMVYVFVAILCAPVVLIAFLLFRKKPKPTKD